MVVKWRISRPALTADCVLAVYSSWTTPWVLRVSANSGILAPEGHCAFIAIHSIPLVEDAMEISCCAVRLNPTLSLSSHLAPP